MRAVADASMRAVADASMRAVADASMSFAGPRLDLARDGSATERTMFLQHRFVYWPMPAAATMVGLSHPS